MQWAMTSRRAWRTCAGGGSPSPERTAARRFASRWAAAIRKWPEPAAGVDDRRGRGWRPRPRSALAPDRLVHDRVEGRVEQAVDEARRRVVGARGLALVAGGGAEREPRRVGVDLDPRVELEEALVDAAELLGAEVAVVDEAEAAVLLDRRQGADRVEQVLVAQLRGVEVRAGLATRTGTSRGPAARASGRRPRRARR